MGKVKHAKGGCGFTRNLLTNRYTGHLRRSDPVVTVPVETAVTAVCIRCTEPDGHPDWLFYFPKGVSLTPAALGILLHHGQIRPTDPIVGRTLAGYTLCSAQGPSSILTIIETLDVDVCDAIVSLWMCESRVFHPIPYIQILATQIKRCQRLLASMSNYSIKDMEPLWKFVYLTILDGPILPTSCLLKLSVELKHVVLQTAHFYLNSEISYDDMQMVAQVVHFHKDNIPEVSFETLAAVFGEMEWNSERLNEWEDIWSQLACLWHSKADIVWEAILKRDEIPRRKLIQFLYRLAEESAPLSIFVVILRHVAKVDALKMPAFYSLMGAIYGEGLQNDLMCHPNIAAWSRARNRCSIPIKEIAEVVWIPIQSYISRQLETAAC